MQTTTITLPIDSAVKAKVKAKVEEHGIKFSVFMSVFVGEFLKSYSEENESKTDITINLDKPSTYLKQAIEKARRERTDGDSSPTFDNAEDAIKWLHK